MSKSLLKKITISLNIIVLITPALLLLSELFLWFFDLLLKNFEHESILGQNAEVFIPLLLFYVISVGVSILHIFKEKNKNFWFNILNGFILFIGITFWWPVYDIGAFPPPEAAFTLLVLPTHALNLLYVNLYRVG